MSARRAASSAFRALSGSRATTTRGRALATSPTDARASASATPRVNTVDPRETAKFEADAALWWDEERGPFAPLHAMNPVRCEFVRDVLVRHFRASPSEGRGRESPSHHATHASARPLAGLRLLDVGCGGGILCEALARMGADVVGVDAAPANVAVADAHASLDPAVAARTSYRAVPAETLLETGETFDAVLSLEVIEHVADPEGFVRCLAGLARPGGAVILSTINRTARAYAAAILAAERVAGWVPPGTHEFSKFITPEELAALGARAGLELREAAGMTYAPPAPGSRRGFIAGGTWRLTGEDLGVNYLQYFAKEEGR